MGYRIEIEEIENKIIKQLKIDNCIVILKQIKKYPYKKIVLFTDTKKIKELNLHNKLIDC